MGNLKMVAIEDIVSLLDRSVTILGSPWEIATISAL